MKRLFFTLLLAGFSLVGQPFPVMGAPASYTPDPVITGEIASDPGLIERKLDLAMRKVLANPKALEIKLEPINASETALGHFQKITVKTESGEIEHLPLKRANIDFYDVALDTQKLVKEEHISTVNVGSITLDVIITEFDLNTFLDHKSKKIKVIDPKVILDPGKITLSGSTKYSIMNVSFWATGVFSVVDSANIYFHPKKMKVNGMPMPRAFVGNIVKRINPILKLTKFPFKVHLKEIKIEQGYLHFISNE